MRTPAVGDGLQVVIETQGDLVLAALAGSLDIYTAPGLLPEIEPYARAYEQVVIDLAEVALIDSSGLGALVTLRNQVQREGAARLGLVCPRRRLLRVFEIAGLGEAFLVGPDLAAVRVALAGDEGAGDERPRGSHRRRRDRGARSGLRRRARREPDLHATVPPPGTF